MSLDTAKYKGGKDFGRAEDGMYPARLVQAIELGMQEQTDWKTKESTGFKPRVMLTFELPTERIEIEGETRPRWYSKEYTLSDHELSGIHQVIRALDPVETNLSKLIGKACMIEIGTTSGGKPKITNVVSVVKGMEVAELENPVALLDLDDPDLEVYKRLPLWLREKIKGGKNFDVSKLALMISTDENFDDDLPF